MALCGGPGAGKTWTSLALATGLGHHIALIDTERGSARKYADVFDFDVCELATFHPVQSKYSCGLAVVVFEQPTEPLSAFDWPFTIIGRPATGKRNRVAQALVTTLGMVMGSVLKVEMAILHRPSKGIAVHEQADDNVVPLFLDSRVVEFEGGVY